MTLHPNCMPCRINGKVYPSQKDAAAALGVTPSTISQAIREGRTDNVSRFLGRRGNTSAGKPIRIGRHEWPSKWSAARALGMDRHALSRAVKPDASTSMRERLFAALLRFDRKLAEMK